MTLRLIAAAAIASAIATSANAATPPDLSKVQCENPKFEHFILTQMPRLVSTTDSSSFAQKFAVDSIGSASTVSSAPDELICEVTFSLAYRGMSRPAHGQFSLQFVPGGKQRVSWKPGY